MNRRHTVRGPVERRPAVERKLTAGADVADLACGCGASTILMAEAFPNSRFVGYDHRETCIETARRRAAETGVPDRVRFEVASVDDYPGVYDLVTGYGFPLDTGDPVGVARHVLGSLKPDGTWIIVEPRTANRARDGPGPAGCPSTAGSVLVRARATQEWSGTMAIGTPAGSAWLDDVIRTAGFTRVREAALAPFHVVLEARP
ncbi:Methyltransferase domain-containing protein [Haloechinothrix alba]|uniref:Methyltransferase domain-containing protein n=1 Tax=Haloechinothrix alba TaxID=664784 RepID=A0A238ZBY9_9PSEU|nr:class I SAM-dependent methyltransferase [Haloechinothrix alba]SNR80224.1 Methyltransferase domain-containing protein [Haloechinothrix alba]